MKITEENESLVLHALEKFYKAKIEEAALKPSIGGSLRQLSLRMGYDPSYIDQVLIRGKILRLKKVYDEIKKI